MKKLALVLTLGLSFSLARPALAMTTATEHPGSLPILLGLDSVRAELRLNSLQKAVLDSLREEYRADARKLVAAAPQTPEARAAAEKSLAALNARYNRRALSVLNDSQQERFVQIERQVLGAVVLFTPSGQRALGLSPGQLSQVEKIRQTGLLSVAKVNRKYEEGKIDFADRMSELHRRKAAMDTQLLALLTPAQRTQLTTLEGKTFKL